MNIIKNEKSGYKKTMEKDVCLIDCWVSKTYAMWNYKNIHASWFKNKARCISYFKIF